MTCRVVHALQLPLEPTPLDPDQVVAGTPEVAAAAVSESPLEVGVWQHSVGISSDIEADEVFVVLNGRATIEVVDGPTLEVGPGDIGILQRGAQTTWTVHEALRKVYVLPPD